ncbi:hypothetical protein OESDEN_02511 [Oesophagostomum dentatum]|uniref:PAZ domain-containing protein n=1 Tax=Oesophagostomum dentatum TaxID=61180 RepID=A0A0B1TNU5_OESDE|nr:hypothetical protein OESDEN_02511 [Oesophagostomum dentatum]
MALPDVPVYDNPQDKGFDAFLRSFLMKYGSLNLGDQMLIHLLCTKLGGQPRTVMETLPLDAMNGTFDGFVTVLREKLKQNESARRMEAYVKLKKLRSAGSIFDYCVELEQLSRAAYPESSEKELSILRTDSDVPKSLQGSTKMKVGSRKRILRQNSIKSTKTKDAKVVARAYVNSGESPFFLLHGFDAHTPRDSTTDKRISTYMVDLDSYVNEMLVGMKLAHEHAQLQNEKARERMKSAYDKNKKVIERPLTLGDRVYMRLPTEKSFSKHPKLTNEWSGPFRVHPNTGEPVTVKLTACWQISQERRRNRMDEGRVQGYLVSCSKESIVCASDEKKSADETIFSAKSFKESRKNQAKLRYLLPELVYPTGLTDSMRRDNRQMKELSKYTRLDPEKRRVKIEILLRKIYSSAECISLLQNWGISLQNELISFKSRELEPEAGVGVLVGRHLLHILVALIPDDKKTFIMVEGGMIVGYDLYHDSTFPGQTVAACVSTADPECTKFYRRFRTTTLISWEQI